MRPDSDGHYLHLWLHAKTAAIGGAWMKRVQDAVRDFAGRFHYVLVRYETAHRRAWMDSVTAIKQERDLLLNHCEACQLISALTATEKLGAEVAEVGVAYGASAKLIAKYASSRPIHLFDTFEGLPQVTEKDGHKFSTGQFRSTLENVQEYVSDRQVHFYRGLFPRTAETVKNKVFSFVHLDVDLYESTMDALNFFYPRMCIGGIILSHDHLTSVGVNAAFKEFFTQKTEPVIELTGYQCMVVKTSAGAG
jgi:O-methyltransferase